ncbi:hypothetical protein LTR84_000836 [Exophiala bonariae]|uniref:Major facilitator superfamily (MFS) profile domain-containing protein n=1 Tax=Exophiala bonariae TaxID=1690606 RepID=A0AAV9NRP9_9EURO|nr:hypothetical protein LTR84_000836 [Exophiala bonariae]
MAVTEISTPPATATSPARADDNIEKHAAADNVDADFSDDGKLDDGAERKQAGVRQVEAITTVWSKQMLVVMFILLYIVSFCDSLLQGVQGNLSPYVTSEFSQHGLLATTGIVASILGGVSSLAIAKIIDIWGRVEGFLAMLLLMVVGIVMKAACQNVQTYAAAHTLYWVGHLGLIYVISIILADTTTLKNRAIIYGLNYTPTIATNFAGPRIADLFYTNVNFRWAFGAFCIILVAFCAPVAVIFILSKRKAVKQGIYPVKTESRTVWESCKYYFVQFDGMSHTLENLQLAIFSNEETLTNNHILVVGMFLTVVGWSLLLLPFNLVYTAPKGWETGYIIAMIVLGVLCLAAFFVWEKYFATVAYLPFRFLKDRTIIGACLLYGIMFLSIFCWDTYYGSYLQVVHGLDITISGYVLNSFSLTSAFFMPLTGLLIRWDGRYKVVSYTGIPFCVLGTALLIHFRTPSSSVGYLVMCQMFNGISSGVWVTTGQLAVQASVSHQELAVATAIFSMFGSIGAAIGMAIAGSLWTNTLPTQLYNRLPADAKDLAAEIYGSIIVQQSYPLGSPVRDAIIAAYADVQRKMVIAGAAFIPLLVICIMVWRNVNVKKLEAINGNQVKGTVW